MKRKPSQLFNYVITLGLVSLAGWACFSLYSRYVENPWTRDGQVRANIVEIAPRVSGPIIRVAVRDNQQVKEGDLLFEIDPNDFQAQADMAAGQVQNAEATFTERQQNLQRQTYLYRTHVNALQDFQNAQDSFGAAHAQLASAQAGLELAKLRLSYTKVVAPVDGYVTNMNTSPGTFVTAGVQLMAVVDTSSYWVAGYFKETQLPHIKLGQQAIITMMGYEKHPSRVWCGALAGEFMFRMDQVAAALRYCPRSARPSIGSVSRNASRFGSRSWEKLRCRCGSDRLFP